MEDLKPALHELLAVAPAGRHTTAYQYDLVDLARQVMANRSRVLLPQIKDAYDAKDLGLFRRLTGEWMRDMKLQDKLLASNEYFLLGRWLSYLQAWSSSPAERALINYDARSILTTWGNRKASEGSLHEYGNRDWAGLARDYYTLRWQMYFDSLDKALANHTDPEKIDWYAVGDRFNHSTRPYSAVATGDSYVLAQQVAAAVQ